MTFDAEHKKSSRTSAVRDELVREMRLELTRHRTHAPQTCLSTIPALPHIQDTNLLYRSVLSLSTGFFQKNHDFFCLEPFPTPPPGSFAQTNKDLAPREGE